MNQAPPSADDISERQDTIAKLIGKRMVDDDNCYLRVSEMNYFEKIKVYADSYPLLNVRLQLWYIYM